MKRYLITSLITLAAPLVHAALTTNLVAHWGFEGNANNSTVASGGTAYNGTLMGNAALTGGSVRVGSGSLVMDGNGDYLDVTTIVNVNQPWSISAWYRADVAPSGTTRFMVFETSGGAYPISFGLREGTLTTNTNHQTFTDTTPAPDPLGDFQIADTSTAGTWHHVALAFIPATVSTAGSIASYIDGTLRTTLVIPANNTLVVPSAGFHIGTYRNADGRWFDGAIDEVAIWNRTLTSTEINNANTGINADSLYQRGLAGLAVPEPAAALLGGLGMLVLLRRRVR